MSPRRTHRLLGVLLAIVLLASACSDDSGVSTATPAGDDADAVEQGDQEPPAEESAGSGEESPTEVETPAEAPDGADVIATVGVRTLTVAELDTFLPDPAGTSADIKADLISRWIVFGVLEQELENRGESSTEADLDTAIAAILEFDPEFDLSVPSNARIVDQQRVVALAERYAAEVVAAAGGADTEPPGFLCSNHILLATADDAEVTLARLDGGEDFAELAIELSTGPSGPSGGDLGCVVEGSFVPAFEAAAYEASAGEVIGPVETEFGFHVIEIESVGPATVEFHPDVPPEELETAAGSGQAAAENQVLAELQNAAFTAFVDTVTVDERYGTFDPAGFVVRAPG